MLVNVIAGCHLNLRYSDMNGLFVIDHDVDATDAGRHQRKGVKFRTFKFVLTLQLGSLLLERKFRSSAIEDPVSYVQVRTDAPAWKSPFGMLLGRQGPMWPLCSSKVILILVFVVCALQLPIKGCRIVLGIVCQVLIFLGVFFPGTIFLVFATVWN